MILTDNCYIYISVSEKILQNIEEQKEDQESAIFSSAALQKNYLKIYNLFICRHTYADNRTVTCPAIMSRQWFVPSKCILKGLEGSLAKL